MVVEFEMSRLKSSWRKLKPKQVYQPLPQASLLGVHVFCRSRPAFLFLWVRISLFWHWDGYYLLTVGQFTCCGWALPTWGLSASHPSPLSSCRLDTVVIGFLCLYTYDKVILLLALNEGVLRYVWGQGNQNVLEYAMKTQVKHTQDRNVKIWTGTLMVNVCISRIYCWHMGDVTENSVKQKLMWLMSEVSNFNLIENSNFCPVHQNTMWGCWVFFLHTLAAATLLGR